MSRQDQINAELAAKVEPEKQSVALNLKQSLTDDDRVSILTDDEAIIATGHVYDRLAKIKDTAQNITLATGFGFAVLAMIGENLGTFVIGVGVAYAIYYFMWIRRKKNILAEILEEFWKVGDGKKARLKLTNKSASSPTSAATTSAFDVPPQDG